MILAEVNRQLEGDFPPIDDVQRPMVEEATAAVTSMRERLDELARATGRRTPRAGRAMRGGQRKHVHGERPFGAEKP